MYDCRLQVTCGDMINFIIHCWQRESDLALHQDRRAPPSHPDRIFPCMRSEARGSDGVRLVCSRRVRMREGDRIWLSL